MPDITFHSWQRLKDEAMASISAIDLPADLQIPSLPMAFTRFVEASQQPDVDIRDLGKIIEYDPGLTMELLKCVNVASFGVEHPARTPTEAILRLGIPTARYFVLTAGMKSSTLGFDSKLMNHHKFWNESIQKALFAQSVAHAISTDKETAFMGGLLQDFMLPLLTNMFDADYLRYLDEAGDVSLCDWEQQQFGWNHASIAAHVAQKWHLPDELVCGIFFHHRMELPLSAPDQDVFDLFPVTVAALLPDQLRQVPGGIKRLLLADQRSDRFDLVAIAETVDQQLGSFCDGEQRTISLAAAFESASRIQMQDVP